jgi:hypothetical protein
VVGKDILKWVVKYTSTVGALRVFYTVNQETLVSIFMGPLMHEIKQQEINNFTEDKYSKTIHFGWWIMWPITGKTRKFYICFCFPHEIPVLYRP